MVGKPAARLTDMHLCPEVTAEVPHVGGPIIEGSPNVFIGGLAAARVDDQAVCIGPTDQIQQGSSTVKINNKAAARVGDKCRHGGEVILGCLTVLVG